MIIKEEDFILSSQNLSKCKRRKFVTSSLLNIVLDKINRLDIDNTIKESIINRLEDVKNLSKVRDYKGLLDLSYDEFNDIEILGLNSSVKNYLIVYDLCCIYDKITQDIFDIPCDIEKGYNLFCGDKLGIKSISLDKVGITYATKKLEILYNKAFSSTNFSAFGENFIIKNSNPEVRAIKLIIQLLLRRYYYLSHLTMEASFDSLREQDSSLVPVSLGLTNCVFSCNNKIEPQPINLRTKYENEIVIEPRIIECNTDNCIKEFLRDIYGYTIS